MTGTRLRTLPAAGLAAVLALGSAAPVAAQEALPLLNLTFLPPDLGPRDLCNRPPDPTEVPRRETDGQTAELTDEDRLTFLRRDTRRLEREDPEQYFDYLQTLYARRAELDPDFAGTEEMLARIRLYIRAGRLAELADIGLVTSVTAMTDRLSNAQRLTLAQFHADGVGTPRDPALAQALILEAAYGGHPRALLEIARLKRMGEFVEDWDASLELTVTMALGAILGGVSPGLCGRAEDIARAYLAGDLLQPDPVTALAWRRFAADMGDATAAWRVVEYHLDAPLAHRNDAELRRYLARALELGHSPGDADLGDVAASGAIATDDLRALLAQHRRVAADPEGGISPWLALEIRKDGEEAALDGPYVQHLRELAALTGAPGRIYAWLAQEVAVRRGRWAGEGEVIALLEEAVRRGDPLAMEDLAGRLVRYRDDPAFVARTQALLVEAVERYGHAPALQRLDALYRCQVNDAPRMDEAAHWARLYRASGHDSLPVTAVDLITLDPLKDPEAIARVQTHALDRRSTAVAQMVTQLQAGRMHAADAMRLWAPVLGSSDQALEAFAELQFELARDPAERDEAVRLFRRVYLNNGVTTALDLAIALVEHEGRDPAIAAEIVDLLTRAGHRGEGAAIRLLSRLTADRRSAEEVYATFADVIEARGDFLALMFAMPFLPDEKVDDYIDRAVSLMTCGTKDADELGDAYALRGMGEMSYHWRGVGLQVEGGHVLAKLRLSDAQMAMYDAGATPDAVALAARAEAEGAARPNRRAYWMAADPGQRSYDPARAADLLAAALAQDTDRAWALGAWRSAGPEVRAALPQDLDVRAVAQEAAEAGGSAARFTFAMLLRDGARGAEDLAASADWLARAAEAGHPDAMVELGYALGFGLGVPQDDAAALDWLDRAAERDAAGAARLAALLRAR